jgi:hypothetical protein
MASIDWKIDKNDLAVNGLFKFFRGHNTQGPGVNSSQDPAQVHTLARWFDYLLNVEPGPDAYSPC